MAYTLNNRQYGIDNITPGNAKGLENTTPGSAPPAILVENISVGNPEPLNVERTVAAQAMTYGTEIP